MDDDASAERSRRMVAALLRPKSIAIIGATDRPGSWTARIWRNLQRYGFPGAVYPVNPKRDTIWEVKCHADVASLPEPADHLVVLVPAKAVPGVLASGAEAGARSATIFTSGFDEAEDADGQALGRELKAVIEQTGLAVSGPNCLGNIAAPTPLMTMTDDRPQTIGPGPVAIVGQSGGLLMAIKRTLEERGVQSGYVVTSGNETGLTSADYIHYFAADEDTRVIVSYLDAVQDPPAYLAACRAARAAGKPVVVVKIGLSAAGRAAAMTHTGTLAGSVEAFDAIAGEAGAVRVDTLDDAIEAVEYFLHAPLPKGANLGAITYSGALRGLLLDRLPKTGLHFPELADATKEKLESMLGAGALVGNPLDGGFAAVTSEDIFIACIEAMIADPGIDMVLLQEEIPRVGGTRKTNTLKRVEALAAKSLAKPVVFFSMISHGLTDYARELKGELGHLPFLHEVEKSLRAIGAVTAYAAAGRRAEAAASGSGSGAEALPDAPAVEAVRRAAGEASAPRALNEVESKALLAAYGIPLPEETLVASADEAVAAAERLGWPVVLKAVSSKITHKSDAGAVLLGLASAAAVEAGYQAISANVEAHRPGTALDGMLVAKQVTGGLELVLGVSRDPEMGPVVMFGTGGVWLELYKDVAFSGAPLDADRAEAMIAKTHADRLIDGYRGAPAADRRAVIDALVSLGRIADDLGDVIESIDINPFVALEDGNGGYALDGLVVVRPSGNL
ncbi:MAG: acetate--CoA ligase family protein [Proteobacteria bacterium]|nr:acetate--CoA ligase family protein [Pseudomonadota bacterium]